METDLGSSATSDDLVVLDRPLDDHDGVVETALDLGDELLGATTKKKGAGHRLRSALEQVEPLAADLALLERAASAEVLWVDVGARRLDRTTDGLHDALEVVLRDATGAEDVAVGKVLRREVSNREAREDDLGARVGDRLKLVVDDGPLGVDDRLVFLQ